jgi:hypothetical protein
LLNVICLQAQIDRLWADIERLRAAIKWTRQVCPGKTPEGNAVVEMTWVELNTMRSLADEKAP